MWNSQARKLSIMETKTTLTNNLFSSSSSSSLKNNELAMDTDSQIKCIELNCIGIDDFIRQYNSLRFNNVNRVIRLKGKIKTDINTFINYDLVSKNLAIKTFNMDYFKFSVFSKPSFDNARELNNFLKSSMENEITTHENNTKILDI
jgi:hypothetical protein